VISCKYISFFARFCKFQNLFKKKGRKNWLKEGSEGADVDEGKFVLNIIKKLINNSRGKYKRNECLINVCKSDTDLS
jgi:hypothetical protein